MPLELDRTTKTVDLAIPDFVPDDVASDIKADVGQYLVDAILDSVGSGKSPVSGYGSFKTLSKKYADEEKGGRRLPNLDLEGDMLGALTYEVTDEGVEVGIFDSEQARKSFGHNTGFEGHPVLEGLAPERRFIPDDSEDFQKKILTGIDRIIKERVADFEAENDVQSADENQVNTPSDLRSTDEIMDDLRARRRATSSALDESELDRITSTIAKRRGRRG